MGIDGLVTSASLLPELMLPVSVTIGGVAATDISYAGSAPGLVAGALQVNVRIPTSVGSGDLPVVVEIVDAQEKVDAFLPVLDGMMSSGLVTIEKVQVLQYGKDKV